MEKKGNVCPFCVALVPDKSQAATARQVILSSGRKLSVVIPANLSGQEVLESMAFLGIVQDELFASEEFGDHEDEAPDEVELPMKCSGRVALLMVPKGASAEELLELREDMMSLAQPNVLEDALAESKAVNLATIVGMN